MRIEREFFGYTDDDYRVDLLHMHNDNGMSVAVSEYGAGLAGVRVPDSRGKVDDVLFGYSTLQEYIDDPFYLGATVGRYANRIAGANFTLDGTLYKLDENEPPNHLHGGFSGLNRAVWTSFPFRHKNECGINLTYTSPDGESGYPGNLDIRVTYSLTNFNELIIEYSAFTDKATIISLTNHGYWNLSGCGRGKIYDHKLFLSSDSYLKTDTTGIPTGEITKSKGTPMDFSTPRNLGKGIAELKNGYDHCCILDNSESPEIALAASLEDPLSRRNLKIYTNSPAIQIYTGNFLDGRSCKSGALKKHSALCLETQEFPDAAHHNTFPSPILLPGCRYDRTTKLHFSTV